MSKTSHYALVVLAYLASRPAERVQASQVAHDTRIPHNYLSKVLNQLRKQGFVWGRKGWGGGYQLRAEAVQRPLIDIVQVFDGSDKTASCLCRLGHCDPDDPCPLHPSWSAINTDYHRLLVQMTIADIVPKTSPLRYSVTSLSTEGFID